MGNLLFKELPKLGKLFPAGEMISREGDVVGYLHIIQSGLAEVYQTGFDGNRIHHALLKAGDMFGILTLFDKKPLNSSLQALEDTWVLRIDKRSILRRIYEDPSLVLRIMENLSMRLRAKEDKIVELTNDYHAAIGGLGSIADAIRLQEIKGRVDNVVDCVAQLCQQLNARQTFPEVMDANFLANMKMASYFYDIGNAGLPVGLLTKQSVLSAQEKERVQTHIHIGSRVLKKAGESAQGATHFLLAAELAQYHHEKFDGTGYLGLRGGQIPVSARIVSVVDVFFALLVHRPYRKAFTRSEAIEWISARAGTYFDPQVVEAFLAVILDGQELR